MRLQPDQRRSVIITAAIRVAHSEGLPAVNHGSVAKRCTVKTSSHTVRHYFDTQADLWRAVVAADAAFTEAAKELGL